MVIIEKYFKNLTPLQKDQFSQLPDLYGYLNSMVNLISRKDIDHLYERHVLHSLSISYLTNFAPGTQILDAGTGGGFPGIPLAILLPQVKFTLVDSIGKKINCVNKAIEELGLANVTAFQARVEELDNNYDFVVSRAVTSLPAFYKWVKPLISSQGINSIPNGIIYLKGGDFIEELTEINKPFQLCKLSGFFEEEYFQTKQMVFIPV